MSRKPIFSWSMWMDEAGVAIEAGGALKAAR